jgi:hypothetical protein
MDDYQPSSQLDFPFANLAALNTPPMTCAIIAAIFQSTAPSPDGTPPLFQIAYIEPFSYHRPQ